MVIRLLPFIVIPIVVLILGGLGYWRFTTQQSLNTVPVTSLISNNSTEPAEVPNTLPALSLEDRVKSLEDIVDKFGLTASPKASVTANDASLNSRVMVLEAAVTDLKARVAVLEKGTTITGQTATSSKSPLYIPLGSGGGPWGDRGWYSLPEYQIAINSDDYSGYTNMQLEVNFRLVETSGIASMRLYNLTDNSAVSTQVDTTANSFGLKTSNTFRLASGQKTYTVQIKSTEGVNVFIQSARIKVNF